MEVLFDALIHLGNYDGYFGYRVYNQYIEYVDIDNWAGNSEPKYWSHQEFYDQFKNEEDSLIKGVIRFLIEKEFVKPIV